jgi:hypothetical protein
MIRGVRVLVSRGYARDEILRFAQNDKDGGVAFPYILFWTGIRDQEKV